MNKLGRDVLRGEIVVTDDGKLWEAMGGAGLVSANRGSAFYAHPLDEEGNKIQEGTWRDNSPRWKTEDIRNRIDPALTLQYNEALLDVYADAAEQAIKDV